MANLVQQVNFYHLSLQSKKVSFSAATMLLMIFIALLGLILVSSIAVFQTRNIEAALQALENDKNLLLSSLEETKNSLKPRQKSHLLAAKRGSVEKNLKDARRMAAIIRNETNKNSKLYSDYFRGLAQTTIQGLWLRRITVTGGSNEFGLSGEALKPELVPQLLQSLSKLTVFKGISFSKVLFFRNEEKPQQGISFELTTSKPEEVSEDAG
jgi:hypothetical protein